ncbi:hypothetical protein MHBO_001850 [Bonamia ostreae]|uniref:Histone-binding protein RBBP4-like N-terminal domain-containing protein n=1 Tax=Bonamia ostreae TaxID=126728 RepID=A0ABV2AKD0_9EUKA
MVETTRNTQKVFRPNMDEKRKKEEMKYDSSAYLTLNDLRTDLPSLSFDIVSEENILGQKIRFPIQTTFVAGTQAPKGKANKVSIFRVSNIQKTKYDDGNTSSDDSDEGKNSLKTDDIDPVIKEMSFNHPGAINRIRTMPQNNKIISTWSDNSKVYAWNASDLFDGLKNTKTEKSLEKKNTLKPIGCNEKHSCEGFALSWNPHVEGTLISGDCNGAIYLNQINTENLDVSKTEFKGHLDSVEDVQWDSSNQHVIF